MKYLSLFAIASCLSACQPLKPLPPQTPTILQNQLIWQDCQHSAFAEWFSDEISPGLECATLVVPLDNAQPKSGAITLALTRLPATGERMGNLLIIAGGPGDDSLNSVYESFGDNESVDTIRQHFDVIGYAPRGVSPSTPALDCGDDVDSGAEQFVAGCITHSGHLLPHISTKDAVLDVERIRQALGDDKLSLIGYSYGTKVLAGYVGQFPQMVQAAVFDGVVNPSEDLFVSLAGQATGFGQSFDRFAHYCIQYEACPFETADNYQQGFWNFLNSIDQKELMDKNGNPITADEVLSMIDDNLMWQSDWEHIIALMEDLQDNNTEVYNELYGDDDPAAGADMGLAVINCADQAPSDKSDYLSQIQKIDALATYDDYRQKDDSDYLDACYYWPYVGTDTGTLPAVDKRLAPLLFVAQRYDPTTPHNNAVAMANHFGAPLLTRDGDGHTLALTGESRCIDERVAAYLMAPTTPQKSHTCP